MLLPLDDLAESATMDGKTTQAALVPLEDQLWARWRELADAEAREALINHYAPYARMLAAKIYSRRISNEFEFNDYLQYATIGLIESVDRFDPQRGVKFMTYATLRVEGEILSGLERLSEQQQQLGLKRRLKRERLQDAIDNPPSQDDPEDVLRFLADVGIGLALGFILEGEGLIQTEEAALPDLGYQQLELKQLRARLLHYVRQLTEREQEVVRMHYLHEISFEEISRMLGISKGRVSQLHKQALNRLRGLLCHTEFCDVSV